MRILMTGGTGLLGNAIGRRLARNHQILVLSRDGKESKSKLSYPGEVVAWDGRSELNPRLLEGVEVLIHLAGENIAAGKWTPERKQALKDSRVHTVELIDKALRAHNRQLRVCISASAVGYYGDRGDEELTEESSPGSDFLSELCVEWEKAVMKVNSKRTVLTRFGVVFSSEGGFLDQVLKMFKRFGASRLGSGKQYLSWVHVDDLVEVIAQALSNPYLSGPVNVVAPESVTNEEFTRKLKKAAKCFSGLPVPKFALRLLYGEMADMLLGSQKVRPAKLQQLKWSFRYPTMDSALAKIFSEPSRR